MRELNKNKNQTQLIHALKTNHTVVLKDFYATNYHKIESLVLKNSGTKEHAKDIYQEAFITVWNNVKSDKFIPQSDQALEGYLYTISKNKWMDYLRSKHHKKTIVASKIFNFDNSFSDFSENDDDILKEKRLQVVMHAFKDLGDACKSLLMKFYFEKKPMHVIAEELQLEEASTRNKKYRCMQKLRALALESEK